MKELINNVEEQLGQMACDEQATMTFSYRDLGLIWVGLRYSDAIMEAAFGSLIIPKRKEETNVSKDNKDN